MSTTTDALAHTGITRHTVQTSQVTTLEQYFSLTDENGNDIPMIRVIIVLNRDYHGKAARLAANGERCAVVTTEYTWRGVNGKRKEREISRVEYGPK